MDRRAALRAEYEPEAEELIVSPLACSLVGRTGTVTLSGTLAEIYASEQAREQYFCSFGLNPDYEPALERAGLRVVGRDGDDGAARAFIADGHPFYLATLFVPQVSSTPERPHPVIRQFVAAASAARHARGVGAAA